MQEARNVLRLVPANSNLQLAPVHSPSCHHTVRDFLHPRLLSTRPNLSGEPNLGLWLIRELTSKHPQPAAKGDCNETQENNGYNHDLLSP